MALAINSFPVPVSPRISTAESVGATLPTSDSTLRSDSEDPTIVSYIEERSISSRSARFSLRILCSACLRSSMSVPVAYQRTTSQRLSLLAQRSPRLASLLACGRRNQAASGSREREFRWRPGGLHDGEG